MNYTTSLEEINIVIYTLKLFCISLGTYYAVAKNTNIKDNKIVLVMSIIVISIICGIVKNISDFMISIICLGLLLSLAFTKFIKGNIGYYVVITIISLSINYSLFILAAIISYWPNRILDIRDNYISFISIAVIYFLLIYLFFKIKRFRKGVSFLKHKLVNEYFDVLILNISVIILFTVIILSNYSQILVRNLGMGFIISAIIMFITIQKSLQLYYKQKLLIQELNETKEELDKKKQEIGELEQENLKFSKISHSIAHRQKSLEYKLNTLMMKNEIALGIDLKDRLENIAKEFQQETAVSLTKTNMTEIDDMLAYMQAECSKNKIDFQLKVNGDIHHMTNHYIEKEKLEILLADHIKNAIIAIQYSDNINKSILVRLGMIEGIYSLYVYDSGIEFELETLTNLGKKPSTTHADNGGTGMGFMNTFDTLKQYQASMVIEEYGKPCQNNFTKSIQIKFDKKNEFKICSYRANESKIE